ncbi:MAG TPA: type II toxin-antitoxin system VapC family toxin [Verrucomicrobiales bacterium]|nr:type II toxin-antitoxin system VapC family toxin [Verrucomicrobiales bacterium]HIL71421.1 type II toxin-antitoxin system VapC family toxin [Verrucomicrobiota bacterium]
MAITLDADVIICGEKGSFDLSAWLLTQKDEEFEIAAITVAELWHGVERASGKHRKRRKEYFETVLNVLPVIHYTEEIAREHARIWAELEAIGKMTGYYDLIVAATARQRGSKLATFNRRHFENIVGLLLVPL